MVDLSQLSSLNNSYADGVMKDIDRSYPPPHRFATTVALPLLHLPSSPTINDSDPKDDSSTTSAGQSKSNHGRELAPHLTYNQALLAMTGTRRSKKLAQSAPRNHLAIGYQGVQGRVHSTGLIREDQGAAACCRGQGDESLLGREALHCLREPERQGQQEIEL